MFPVLIDKLMRREDLTTDEAAGAMAEVMAGRASDAQIAGFLVGLAMKGERPAEIVGLARTMRANAVRLRVENVGADLQVRPSGRPEGLPLRDIETRSVVF